MKQPDIDIDLDPRFKAPLLFKEWVRASVLKDKELTPHPCGMYPQKIAVDPVTALAAIPYEEAEELGYYKIDFLNNHVYQHFSYRAEIEELVKKEPQWDLLLVPSIQVQLFQLGKHGELLSDLKPRSLLELSDVMALIRPGKKQLLGLYKSNREAARQILYMRDEHYSFKKAHSYAYSLVVLLQLHLIAQKRL